MFPYDNTCSLSFTQTSVPMIQSILCLRYDMYNKYFAKLYFHVLKHIWLVCHEKPKSCIMGTTVCVEDKEHVFPFVEEYMDTFPWKTINRLSTTMQFHNIFSLVIYFGQGKRNYIFTAMDGEAKMFMFMPIF
jgi:hypothetical protein